MRSWSNAHDIRKLEDLARYELIFDTLLGARQVRCAGAKQ
jgi:hypothetical protein